jgi:hypothetical protein
VNASGHRTELIVKIALNILGVDEAPANLPASRVLVI